MAKMKISVIPLEQEKKSSTKKRKSSNGAKDSTATIGFEAKLWLAADKLRNNMDAAEYKHVVLGLIFLKYISDTFEEHRVKRQLRLGAAFQSSPRGFAS